MSRNKLKDALLKEVSQETGCPLSEVDAIVSHQFEFTKRRMEQGEFDTIRLQYLGKFTVNPRRLAKLNDAAFQRRKFQSKNKRRS